MLAGNEQEAFDLLERAPEPTDPWTRATRWLLGAMLHENEGHFEEHRGYLKRALEGYREVGDRWGLASALAGPAASSSPTATWRARSRPTRRPIG